MKSVPGAQGIDMVWPKDNVGYGGQMSAPGAQGEPGVDGLTILNGSGAPAAGLGVNGDFYIDTTADAIYGPKTGGAWGAATSLIGPQGGQGDQGIQGIQGPQGDPGEITEAEAIMWAIVFGG